MLVASPVLRKPQPNGENAVHSTIRYGSHTAGAHSPNQQRALAFAPAAGVTMERPNAGMSRPPSSSNMATDCHDDATQHSTAGRSGQATTAAYSERGRSEEIIQNGQQRPTESENLGHDYHIEIEDPPQAQSPNVKRRQPSTPLAASGAAVVIASSPAKRPRTDRKEPKVLPVQYELCDVEDIVILIADMIAELIQTNDNLPLQDGVLTRFHSRTPPGISVIDYLQRLAKHAALTPPLLLSMVYYIDLLCSAYPSFTITTLTVHRFLITAATVAAKGLSDSFWNNSTYARVGGIKLAELGLLELDFLHRVDWRIVPRPETLVDYFVGLVNRSERYELDGTQRAARPATHAEAQTTGGFEGKSSMRATENGGAGDGGTDKWEKWMKDVADETGK